MNIIQKPSPNFFKGRNGYKPELIVVHIMDGTLFGTDTYFADTTSQRSSHYGIGIMGDIHQYVALENSAWTEGNVREPTAKLLKKNVNPNYYCISIENEGHNLDLALQPQMHTLISLIYQLCLEFKIPIDRNHIIGHFEIDSIVKGHCPSPDHKIMDRIVAKVVALSLINTQNKMIKFVKFYSSENKEVITYFTAEKVLQNDGMTHEFNDANDAQTHSTSEVVIFWDNNLIGAGTQTA